MTSHEPLHYIIGTAGHVDHGKTALIRALTGVDTDRLAEEQERGISIVLGFAPYRSPTRPDRSIGIVDVPGHERFIKTMVAGATGMDAAIFVVACDESIKPQTREHLEILSLLGVRRGLIVLTKTDLAEGREWIEMVAEEVRDLTAPTFLQEAPLIPVSARTGQGIDELRALLDDLLDDLPPRPAEGVFRLPVDRAFSIKGIGTVVTGSVWSGSIGVGEGVRLEPQGIDTRIRDIQQHGVHVDRAVPGTRAALALHNVSADQIPLGSWLLTPRTLAPTRVIDLQLQHLPSAPAPLTYNQRLRVHHGTAETFGRLRLLGLDELAPGQAGYGQLFLEDPLVAAVGDRLLLRRYSPMRTLAGAGVLDVAPPRHRRRDRKVIERLQQRAEGDPLETIDAQVQEAGLAGVSLAEAARRASLDVTVLQRSAVERGWTLAGDVLVADEIIQRTAEQIVVPALDALHKSSPLRRGFSAEAAADLLGLASRRTIAEVVLQAAEQAGLIERDPPFWRRTGFQVRLDGALGKVVDAIETEGSARGWLPWEREEIEAMTELQLEKSGLSRQWRQNCLKQWCTSSDWCAFPVGS
jgi:selenocysteine-specific elongation factor